MTTTTDNGKSLTDEQLLAIVEAATPGEWQVVTDLPAYAVKSAGRASIVQTPNQNAWNRYGPANEWDGVNGRANAAFIATFDPPTVRSLIERAVAAEQRVKALEEALEPSAGTKAAYIAEFKTRAVVDVDDEGDPVWGDIYVEWTTVKEIMAAIRSRASSTEAQS